MMGRSRHFRLIVGVIVAAALVGMAFAAIQSHHGTVSATVSPESGEVACGGDCATCPAARRDACSEAHARRTTEAVSVDPEKCVGCVRCVNVAPDAFWMNPETGKAEVREGASAESIALGIEACPVDGAIR